MARINGVADREARFSARQVFRAAKKLVGQVPEPLRIMAHSRSVLFANGLFEMVAGRGRTVPASLKSLASIKAAMSIGCVF